MEDFAPLDDDHWPNAYELELESMTGATSEEPFLRASFEFLKEAAGLLTLSTSVSPDPRPSRDRNGAVLVGHMVRMTKLMRSQVRAIVDDHGGDQQMQLTRQFLDSASALAYFLDDIDDSSRIDAYVNDSLISEKEFLKNVNEQIVERGGQELPIETRIKSSIEQTFTSAGVDPAELPARKSNGWPNAQERLKLLGPTAYSAYRAGSGSIHGSWHDLERSHLEVVDGSFKPDFAPALMRPQPLFAMAALSVTLAREYVVKCLSVPFDQFDQRASTFLSRLNQCDSLHEQYLTARRSQQ